MVHPAHELPGGQLESAVPGCAARLADFDADVQQETSAMYAFLQNDIDAPAMCFSSRYAGNNCVHNSQGVPHSHPLAGAPHCTAGPSMISKDIVQLVRLSQQCVAEATSNYQYLPSWCTALLTSSCSCCQASSTSHSCVLQQHYPAAVITYLIKMSAVHCCCRSKKTMAGCARCTSSTSCLPTPHTRSSCWRWISSDTAAYTQRNKIWCAPGLTLCRCTVRDCQEY